MNNPGAFWVKARTTRNNEEGKRSSTRHKKRFFGIDEMFSDGSEASAEVLRRRRGARTRHGGAGEKDARAERIEPGSATLSGNVVLQAVFLFPGEEGNPVPALMVGKMLKDGDSREADPVRGHDRRPGPVGIMFRTK